MAQAVSIAASVLAPGIGSAVSSIAGQVAKSVMGGGSPLGMAGSIFDAFGSIFGQQRQQRPPVFCPPLPLPFSPGPGFPLNNPFGILQQNVGLLNQMLPNLQHALQCFGPGFGGRPGVFDGSPNTFTPAPAPSTGRTPDFSAAAFSAPDSLMAQAQDLLKEKIGPDGKPVPPSQADIFKAQQLMSQANLLAETLSTLLKKIFDIGGKALQNAAN
jgi:hypothetical protein